MPAFSYEEFEISPYVGFVLDLQESLPEYFKPWHDLASNMAEYVEKKTMREETLKLPLLDSSRLQSYGDLRLAHLQLSFICIGYAWQDGLEGAPKSIPENVAVPLCDVCDRVGLEPGASDPDFCGNFSIKDKSKPAVLENLQIRYLMPGGQQVSDFWMLCAETVCHGKDAIPAISRILEASKAKDKEGVAAELRNFAKWFDILVEKSKRFSSVTEPEVFFKYVAKMNRGFNETTGYPDGMLFEGVKNRPRRKTVNVSGGQSVVIPAIEHILGIQYPPEQEKLKAHWWSIMPIINQKFIKFLQAWPGNVKEMVTEAGPESDLALAYNDALRGLSDFRSYHIQLVTRYVVLPNKKIRAENNDTSEDKMATIVPRLKDFRSATDNNKLNAEQTS